MKLNQDLLLLLSCLRRLRPLNSSTIRTRKDGSQNLKVKSVADLTIGFVASSSAVGVVIDLAGIRVGLVFWPPSVNLQPSHPPQVDSALEIFGLGAEC